MPVEAHLRVYKFCGELDELASEYYITYDKCNVLIDRREADKILQEQAWTVFKSKKTGLKEKSASWLVNNALKVIRKLGSGCGFWCAVSQAKKAV